MVVNTTSPLLDHTFEAADRYQYHLWISNAVSTVHAVGRFTGYCYYTLIDLCILTFEISMNDNY